MTTFFLSFQNVSQNSYITIAGRVTSKLTTRQVSRKKLLMLIKEKSDYSFSYITAEKKMSLRSVSQNSYTVNAGKVTYVWRSCEKTDWLIGRDKTPRRRSIKGPASKRYTNPFRNFGCFINTKPLTEITELSKWRANVQRIKQTPGRSKMIKTSKHTSV